MRAGWGEVVVLFEYLNSVSLETLGLVVFVAIVVAGEAGTWLGRRLRHRVPDKDAEALATATLGLLALLIAFTYSMAVARYDLRRSVLLQEANAIGTSVNYAGMLPEAERAPVVALLRRYTQVRLQLGVPYGEAKMARDVAESNALLGQLWALARSAVAAAPQSLPLYRYVASLNETTNVAETRLTALRNHVPVTILLMLAGTSLVAMGFAGYSVGVRGSHRPVSQLIMAALLAFLIVMTQDLARPDRGTIQVSNQALQDALAAIPPPGSP